MLRLKSLAAFALKGKDARKFLQGQLTCDLNQLTKAQALTGAHCNREGRIVALYDLLEQEDVLILITQANLLHEAIKVLQHYGMFSKMTWEDLSTTHHIYADVNGRLSISTELNTAASTDEAEFYYQKILNKQAFLSEATIGKFLPQELELQDPALSFTKGCYLGQEVIARIHYLGKLKRKLQVVASTESLTALDELLVNDKVVGEIVASSAYQGNFYALALININCEAKEGNTHHKQKVVLRPNI